MLGLFKGDGMNAFRVLQFAKDKISRESDWTTGAQARNAQGTTVEPTDLMACKFCSVGAINSLGLSYTEAMEALDCLYRTIPDGAWISEANDNSTHAEVMEWWDRAIALAKQQESAE